MVESNGVFIYVFIHFEDHELFKMLYMTKMVVELYTLMVMSMMNHA
jgi:hypothetical protein